MRVPNLFIAGAPKSGTTAIYQYLGAHEGVYASRVKEPHYFAQDLPALDGRVGSLDAYLSLFDGASADHRYLAEASVWYLYSSSALDRIRRFNPDARIVVMLRNPIELVNSLHLDYCCGYIESEFDLETAWRLSAARGRGGRPSATLPYPELLDYQAIGRLGEQVRRLCAVFPPRQVKLVLFDDFIRCPAAAYRDVLAFLDLPDDGRTEFPVVNGSRINRARRATNSLGIAPETHLKVTSAVKRLFGKDRFRILRTLQRVNAVTANRPVSGTFRQAMRDYYAADVSLLSAILDRDLSHWT